jgi:DNA recombination protein RmuC
MPDATFIAGFVLALLLGAGFAILWMRTRAASSDAAEAKAAAQATQQLAGAISRIEAQLREVEAARERSQGGLEASLTALSRETLGLANALRSPNSRGRWGELTLRRVAELAGMSSFCDFAEQAPGPGDDSKRPDMIVHLPEGRLLPVDAKFPLAAYLEAESATSPAGRAAALDRHAQQLSRHVNALASREYWAQFPDAPELVVLFLPGEHFLGAALERDRELLDRALAKKVMLATPVTLVSVLKGVALGWRQERLAKNAEELRRIAGDFQERARVFGEAYADAGRHLARAVDAYNRSAGSWDARLLPSLQRLKELGAGAADPPEPRHIDTAVREPRPVEPPAPLAEPPRSGAQPAGTQVT